jgi:hypothetical protein
VVIAVYRLSFTNFCIKAISILSDDAQPILNVSVVYEERIDALRTTVNTHEAGPFFISQGREHRVLVFSCALKPNHFTNRSWKAWLKPVLAQVNVREIAPIHLVFDELFRCVYIRRAREPARKVFAQGIDLLRHQLDLAQTHHT